MKNNKRRQSYPQHDKLTEYQKPKEIIEGFIGWIQDNYKIEFAQYKELDEFTHPLVPIEKKPEDLVAEYFGINLKQLEVERRQMLEANRMINAQTFDKRR